MKEHLLGQIQDITVFKNILTKNKGAVSFFKKKNVSIILVHCHLAEFKVINESQTRYDLRTRKIKALRKPLRGHLWECTGTT